MATFVLAHGAWSAAWAWRRMRPLMRESGHDFFAPTYTGLGEKEHLAHAGLNLETHIADVLGVIEAEELSDVVLLGHSYGGMVISAVASRLGRRIDAICYVDAFMPDSDQSLWDITGEFEHNWYIDTQRHQPGYVTPIGSIDFEQVPGVVGFHPLLTLLEAIPFSGEEKAIAKKSYIFATSYDPTPFAGFAEKAKASGWDYHETNTDHFVMQNDPDTTVAVLLGLAR